MSLTICNDYGHGGKDSGTTFGAIKEKDWTLDIGRRTTEGLRKQGIKVVTTRDTDVTLSNTNRTSKVKNSKAKYCISHHINAGGGKGCEVWVSQHNKGKLASEIIKELGSIGLENSRGVRTRKLNNVQDYYFMHRQTGSITTLIVEYGFLDTKKDREFLTNANNRQRCADAIVRAICKVEGMNYKQEAAKPSAPSNTDRDLFYRVVTGSFNDRKNAEERIAALKKAGFDSFIDVYKK